MDQPHSPAHAKVYMMSKIYSNEFLYMTHVQKENELHTHMAQWRLSLSQHFNTSPCSLTGAQFEGEVVFRRVSTSTVTV